MIGGAKGIGLGIDLGLVNQYNRTGSQSYIEPEVLDSLVGVWSAYGMTNDSPDRSTIKNKLSNKGGDFVISNAAFKLNSGFGKYEVDFTSWIQTDGVIASSDKVQNSITGRFLYFNTVNKKEDVPSFKVNITLGQQSKLQYNYIKEDGTSTYIVYSESGIYTIPASYFSKYTGGNAWFGFYQIEGTSTIEQIPSFEGAFVTDGIDDLITSTKTVQEMLGGSNEITVVSMAHFIKGESGAPEICRINQIRRDTRSIRNSISKIGKSGIFGYTYKNGVTTINNILGDKKDCTAEGNLDGIVAPFSVEGYYYNNNSNPLELCSIAWYWTIIANKVLTTDQINQVIAYFNLDRTLKPDILCDVKKQGITNDNHAEFGDKLIDFSGNGRDIQLNNIAWKGDSGIGKYNFSNINIIASNRFEGTVTTNKCHFTKKLTDTTNNFCDLLVIYPNEPIKFKVSGLSDGRKLFVANKSGSGSNYNFDNGEHEVSLSFAEGVGQNNPFGITGNIGDIDVTVEFIPSHAGALCLDGVNDFGKVTGMPIYKDYTFIIDYERISYASSERWVAGVVSKSHVANQGAFILMTANTTVEPGKQAYSFGGVTSFNRDDFTRALVYQSKYKCGDVDLTVGEGVDSNTLWLGTFRDNDQRFFNGAIYSLMSFPYSMSEFLIERQLKKHKLGTLYPDMVEFRPVIKANNDYEIVYTAIIKPDNWQQISVGDYVTVGESVAIQIKLNIPLEVTNVSSNSLADVSFYKEETGDNVYTIYGRLLDGKSPQKIGMTIEQDENYVQWNPIVESNAEYQVVDFYIDTYPAVVGNYYLISSKLRVAITTKGAVDEVTSLTVNGVSLGTSSVNGNRFTFDGTLSDKSPQNINITIDEYIRYEDIVQPYPVLLRFNDENGNEVSWGGKFRVGSTITRIGSAADSNLLPNIYNIFGLLLNDNQVTSSKVIVEKTMVFKAKSAYIFDNNEPNCILSPRLLRIPNSSYKILGYIPDISGHGNHGILHNSAYIEGSGVNEDGSYQFDGVDDFVTIPTVTGGKQVLMKVNWQSIAGTAILYDQRTNGGFAIFNRDYDTNENKVPAYRARNIGGNTYIDGILNEYIYASQLQNITHNIVELYDPELNIGTLNPKIGSSYLNSNYAQMSLYDFMLFDNISTDDKIKELNEYVGIEAKVELPPYYYDAYGKTNLDEDKAIIQQRGIAVGDYDITNYNHAYDKMSGYGGYNLSRFDKSWSSSSNTSIKVVQRNPYDITLKKLGGNSDWEFNNTELKVISNPVSVKFKSNKNIRVTCDYHYYPVGGNSEGAPLGITSKDLIANKDAIITISPISQENIDKYNIDVNRGYYLIYFQLSSTLAVNEEVTIEMLPLYPNALLYDGVTDYSENANIPALTDYTYIFKREFLYNANASASMYSGSWQVLGGGAFISDFCVNAGGANDGLYGFSFGNSIKVTSLESSKIIYGTKTSVNGTNITPGSNIGAGNSITLGKWGDNYRKFVFYKLILYPKTIPLLQINFLKNLMERDEIIDLNNKIFIQE